MCRYIYIRPKTNLGDKQIFSYSYPLCCDDSPTPPVAACIYVCMYVCIYIYVYIYILRQTIDR